MPRIDSNTVSNLLFSAACVMVIAVAAIRIEGRFSSKESSPRPPDPVRELANQPISIADAQQEGAASAKVVLVEFSDFQCPYCARHDRDTHDLIKKEFVDTGKIRHAFMHLPLPVHQLAKTAGMGSECAGRAGKFWEMRRALFTKQALLTAPDAILNAAAELQIDQQAFSKCLSGETASIVERHTAQASALGIQSTPTFVLGVESQDGTVRLSKLVAGAQPIEVFRKALGELIRSR